MSAKNNVIKDKSFDFALRIISTYKYLSLEMRENVLSKQLLRSGTSIGANVNEGVEAQSKADFIHKMSLALKEARETQYWIRLLQEAGYLSKQDNIIEMCKELIYILIAIIKSTKVSTKL